MITRTIISRIVLRGFSKPYPVYQFVGGNGLNVDNGDVIYVSQDEGKSCLELPWSVCYRDKDVNRFIEHDKHKTIKVVEE